MTIPLLSKSDLSIFKGLPNSLKVEIDYMQNIILPAKMLSYKNAWNIETKVMAMDVREIFAEKIRAASDRARYRDFYDLILLFNAEQFDIEEIAGLIRQKEIRKPITQDSMLKNWKVGKKEKEEELTRIYYANNIDDNDIEEFIKTLRINVR